MLEDTKLDEFFVRCILANSNKIKHFQDSRPLPNLYRKGHPPNEPNDPGKKPFRRPQHPQHPPGTKEPVADRTGRFIYIGGKKIQPLSRGAPKKNPGRGSGGPHFAFGGEVSSVRAVYTQHERRGCPDARGMLLLLGG